MAQRTGERLPRHRRHASGQGVVTLSGRDCYTGRWGTPESEAKYSRLVADWLANGRRLPPSPAGLTVAGLAREFTAHCAARFRKRGQPTSYAERAARVMAGLSALFADTPAADFGPHDLRALRRTWTHPAPGAARTQGVSLSTANGYQQVLLAAFRWAVSLDLVPVDTLTRLATVPGLRAGRDEARELPPVGPVPEELYRATLPHLPPVPQAMAQIQRLTGMRPGEVCALRPMDLDRTGDVWIYTVAGGINKSSHKGRARLVPIGPRAQAVLSPFLAAQADPAGYLFRPTRGKRSPRKANHPYLPESYDRVIEYACRQAGLTPWNPNALRHNRATELRNDYSRDVAQQTLGHSRGETTERYARPDLDAAIRAARESG